VKIFYKSFSRGKADKIQAAIEKIIVKGLQRYIAIVKKKFDMFTVAYNKNWGGIFYGRLLWSGRIPAFH
jgi:hypothetical protein